MEKWITALISIGFLIIAMSLTVDTSMKYILIIEGVVIVLIGWFLLMRVKKSKKKSGGKK